MKTRLEEVEEILKRIDQRLWDELHECGYGGVCACTVDELIEEKVKYEIEKHDLTTK